MKVNGFPHLFTAHQIGSLTLKNRIVMAPIDTNLADQEGRVTDSLLAFYERRARGGAAMLIVENSQVDFPGGKNTMRQLSIAEEDTIQGLAKLSDVIHRGGALAAVQIHHAGRETTLEVTGGITPVAPSAIPCGHLQTPVRELNKQEIEELLEKFIRAAVRGKRAGFDLIEIHGAHGYLVGEFLSPYTNRRTDEFGGNLQGRMRFATDLVRGIKEALGKDFPIGFRYSADEFVRGGISLDREGVQIAVALEEAGVDVLHISAGIYESLPTLLEPMSYAQGWRCYLAASVKKAVSVPVMAVGVIREPAFAEEVLAAHKADFVAIGRGLLADADWPKKAKEGLNSDIRRCIGCNEGCLSNRLTQSIQCSVNPETGREKNRKIERLKGKKKSVTVVGGGPAGLEAARAAAMRGCRVALFEKNDGLGGQLRFACIPPGKDKLAWTVQYYQHQMKRLGVDVRISHAATVADVLETSPDLVVVATGSIPLQPQASGLGIQILTPDEILLSQALPLQATVAVIGGGGIGCETALYLSREGFQVSLFEQLGEIALDLEPITAMDIKERIARDGIAVNVNCRVSDLKADGLRIERKNDDPLKVAAGFVVWAAGRTPNRTFLTDIETSSFSGQLCVIGDAKWVGRIHDAIHAGYSVIQELSEL